MYSPVSRLVVCSAFVMFIALFCGACAADPSSNADDINAPFTFVIIPDTHHGIKCTAEQLEFLCDWIIDHPQNLNIQMVGHLGDVGDERGEMGLTDSLTSASKFLKRIVNADIPISVAMGNHDNLEGFDERYPDGKRIRQPAKVFNSTFGRKFYKGATWFGGTYEDEVDNPVISPAGTANHYITFNTPAGSFLVLTLEYYPRVGILDWANDVVQRYPEHHVIVLTHAYLNLDGTLFTNTFRSGRRADEKSINAKDMWKEYFSRWKNLRFIMNGHYITDDGPHQAYLPQVGVHGNTVHSHYVNYQNWAYKDGQLKRMRGWHNKQSAVVRLVTIYPRENLVLMSNYLPEADVHVEPADPTEHPFIVEASAPDNPQ